ncbi:pectinesterase family protein [Telmatobacter bradus]|uniref:pectinesterase family protein n=1 Tax=Telmatobacter bradus TaxID=474953 RepID=UPI003B42B82A
MKMRLSTVLLGLAVAGVAAGQAEDVHVQVSPQYKMSASDSFHFPTIQNALDHAPDVAPGDRLYIHIAPGTYSERISVSNFRPRTTLLGMGSDPSKVVITAAQNVKTAQSTFFSETAEILAEDFQADNLTFENAAGNTGQALAITVTADRAIFKHCRFIGFQDTVYAEYGRQYYVDSYIEGAVDFIFGNAAAVFDKSEIHSTRGGFLTAQARTSPQQKTGYVILNSRVTADSGNDPRKILLGRAWRPYALTVFIHTDLPAAIDPRGWNDWDKDTKNIFYGEYENTGAGADPAGRVPWAHKLTAAEAKSFEPQNFLAGTDHWNPVAVAAKMQ